MDVLDIPSPAWSATLSSLLTSDPCPLGSKRQSPALSLLPTFVRVHSHTDCRSGLYQGFRLGTYRRSELVPPALLVSPRVDASGYHGTFFYTAGVLLHCPSICAFLLSFPRCAHCPLPVQEPILQLAASRSFFRALDLYHILRRRPLLYNIARAGSLPRRMRVVYPFRVVNELYLHTSTRSL